MTIAPKCENCGAPARRLAKAAKGYAKSCEDRECQKAITRRAATTGRKATNWEDVMMERAKEQREMLGLLRPVMET